MSPVQMAGRHASVAAPLSTWKCPACAAENTGRLDQGCTVCHAGVPGRHVGVNPPAMKGDAHDAPVLPRPGALGADGERGDRDHDRRREAVTDAFHAWFRPLRDQTAPEVASLLFAAYQAGWERAQGGIVAEALPPSPTAGTELPGTALSRTMVVALRLYLVNVVPMAGEEIAAGELLGASEVDQLITEWEQYHE